MDRILKILKKENGPSASSVNTIIFKHVYWYMQQISGERLQDHWSSGLSSRYIKMSISSMELLTNYGVEIYSLY